MTRLILLIAAALSLSALVAESQEPPPLALTAPVPYETFQRRPTNVGSLYLAGSTTLGGNIEARFNGGPWARVARNVLPGDWTGELAAQAPGQGTLECRVAGRPETVQTVPNVGLGEVYVVAGQSNAVGVGDTLHAAEHPVFTATILGTDGSWQPMTDPTGLNGKGSVWPLVATRLMSERGVPVAIIPCAVGGTSIADWQPDGTLYANLKARGKRPGGVKEVLWWQGEKDVGLGTSQADYCARGTTLLNAIGADLRCRTRVALLQTEPLRSAEAQATIRAAQTQLRTHKFALPGPDLVNLICDGGFHLVLDEKQRAAADLWAASGM